MNLFDEYCKDHEIGFGGDERSQRKAARLKKRIDSVSALQDEDLSKFSSREEAECHLEEKAVGMVGTIGFWVIGGIISWLIGKLLDRWYDNDNISS